jgi:hypothetical protein
MLFIFAQKEFCMKSILPLSVFILLLLTGCSEQARKKLQPRSTAFGPLNQLVVVADPLIWESPVKDSFEYYFSSAYPILPQPEPIFDLRYFTPTELMAKKERKELRTYIILADLQNESSKGTELIKEDVGEEKIRSTLTDKEYLTIVGKDKWADGQTIIYMGGNGHDQILENIRQNFRGVIKKIQENNQRRIAAGVYLGGQNQTVKNTLKGKIGLDLKVPSDYFLAMENDSKFWLRRETPELSANILIQKMPYTSQDQLTYEGIKSIRDSLGFYVSSENSNTYMVTNDVDLPMLVETTTLNNYYALEARGIWEIENDFMGGPFVSYLLHNPNSNELLFMDGFLYAPGEKKREFMQQIEHVLSTAKF